ncbi:MAG: hypothetical protein ABIE03_06735 [Patescibacteria group bacterium]|nr:hypothetical protein [Patescibacteria group bacterium]
MSGEGAPEGENTGRQNRIHEAWGWLWHGEISLLDEVVWPGEVVLAEATMDRLCLPLIAVAIEENRLELADTLLKYITENEAGKLEVSKVVKERYDQFYRWFVRVQSMTGLIKDSVSYMFGNRSPLGSLTFVPKVTRVVKTSNSQSDLEINTDIQEAVIQALQEGKSHAMDRSQMQSEISMVSVQVETRKYIDSLYKLKVGMGCLTPLGIGRKLRHFGVNVAAIIESVPEITISEETRTTAWGVLVGMVGFAGGVVSQVPPAIFSGVSGLFVEIPMKVRRRFFLSRSIAEDAVNAAVEKLEDGGTLETPLMKAIAYPGSSLVSEAYDQLRNKLDRNVVGVLAQSAARILVRRLAGGLVQETILGQAEVNIKWRQIAYSYIAVLFLTSKVKSLSLSGKGIDILSKSKLAVQGNISILDYDLFAKILSAVEVQMKEENVEQMIKLFRELVEEIEIDRKALDDLRKEVNLLHQGQVDEVLRNIVPAIEEEVRKNRGLPSSGS